MGRRADNNGEPPAKHRLKEWDYLCRDALREEAHDALKKEYAAAIKKARFERLVLEQGVAQGTVGDLHCYRFPVSAFVTQSIQPDKPHSLEVHGRAVAGSIVAVGEKCVEVGLAESLGRFVPHLEVIFDLTVLIDLVDRRLCEIDRDPSRFNTLMAERLFVDLKWPELAPLPSLCNHNRNGDRPLDTAQRAAIERALAGPFCLVWGPPGTGKSHTLLGVLAEFLANGKRVLFVSNTNTAIDNVLEKMLPGARCPYPDLLEAAEEGLVVRIGAQATEEVRREFSPSAIAERKLAELREQLEGLQAELSKAQKKREEAKASLWLYTKAELLVRRWGVLKERSDNLQSPDVLTDRVNALRERREAYEAAVRETIPVLVRQFREAMKTYRHLLKQRKKAVSASVVVADKDKNLAHIRDAGRARETRLASLEASWFTRTFKKSQVHAARTAVEENRRAQAAATRAVEAARSALETATEQEARFVTHVQDELAKITPVRAQVLAAVEHAGEFLPVSHAWGSASLWEKLFTSDSELLGSSLGANLVAPVASLISAAWDSDGQRPDKVLWQMDMETRKAKEELELAKSLLARLAVLWDPYLAAKQFLEHHQKEKNDWQRQLADAEEEIRDVSADMARVRAELEAIEDLVISEAQVLAMTLVKASYDARLVDQRYDVLLIDEFSMASLPQLYCVACAINERGVLCGDHLQLEPIAITKAETGRKWLGQSFYDWHEGPYETRPPGCRVLAPFRVVLDVQRRMPPEVSALVRPWYQKDGNALRDLWEDRYAPYLEGIKHPLLSSRVTIVDTTSTNAYSSGSPSKSYYNLIHAGIVGQICRELLENGIAPEDLRCISPYRDQAALTRAVMRQLCGPKAAENLEAKTTTIHQSQGRESAIVIYDMTDGVQRGLTGFHKRQTPNLLNVALTRTQARLIVVCAYEKMRARLAELDEQAALADVLDAMVEQDVPILSAQPYADAVFKRITAEDLLGTAGVMLTEEQRNSILVLDSATYYEALAGDLRQARESILIVCPFITRSRMARLAPLIRDALVRTNGDLKVQIITRPPETMFDRRRADVHRGAALREVLDELVDLGAEVTLAPNAHGKLVVIDNRVNYWGSINTLSFSDTDEINTRMDAPGLSKQLIRLARSGKSWPYRPPDATGVADTRRPPGPPDPPYSPEELKASQEEISAEELRQLGWRLAGRYHWFRARLMWGKTIQALVTRPPMTWAAYRQIEEFGRKNCILWNHLDEIEDIIWPIRGWRLPDEGKPALPSNGPHLFE